MALEIEDGTGKADAVSFVTVDEYTAFATARGFTVPSNEAIEINAIKAIDYIKSREDEYSGDRFSVVQALPFPRINQEIYGVEWSETDPVTPIPQAVKDYQLGVMKALADGIDLFPTSAERTLKRSKTGPLEKEWFDNSIGPTVTYIDALIAPLLGSGGFALVTRRI